MARIKGWFEALSDVIDRHRGLPFQYGLSDCFIFPMDCVAAIVGADPWPDQRDYDSEFGAAKRLRAQGFVTVGDAFAAKLTEIPVMMMGRGDICVVEQNGDVCGCVCAGGILIGKAKSVGLTMLPRTMAARAFKVG